MEGRAIPGAYAPDQRDPVALGHALAPVGIQEVAEGGVLESSRISLPGTLLTPPKRWGPANVPDICHLLSLLA